LAFADKFTARKFSRILALRSFVQVCRAWFKPPCCKTVQRTFGGRVKSRATSLAVNRTINSISKPQLTPEWIDARQAKQLFCLGKTTLYHLAETGRIKTASLRDEGKQRGKRLFSCHSIRQFLENQAV
jgi:hypothetical protein